MVRRTLADEYQGALESLGRDVENGLVSESDATAIRRFCAAFDPDDATEPLPRDLYEKRRTKHVKSSTRSGWVERLRVIAHDVELTADDTDADDINRFTTNQRKASGDDGKRRFSTSHVRNLEHAARKFYRFHGELGVDVDAIVVHEHDNGSTWDARDLLDADERAALRTVAEHARDLAIYHLGLYTGMRNSAIRTLRIRDIDLANHEWYFNGEADGLKDIHRPDEPRPLFQAERAVRDWLDYHPDPQPDHYLITGKPKYGKADPTKPVTRETIRYTMMRLKEKTADRDDVPTVEKPCHPHMLRHNFVSMCRRHPDISDGDIKFYLGHAEGSDIMETTYSHLSSDDHNSVGHAALGVAAAANGKDDVDPWDTTCQRCDRVLAPGDEVCDVCGTERGASPWDDGAPEDAIRSTVREEMSTLARAMFAGSTTDANDAAKLGDLELVDMLAESNPDAAADMLREIQSRD